MVGYGENCKAYRLYNPQSKKLIISRDVTFLEDKKYSEVNMLNNVTNVNSSSTGNQDLVGNLTENPDCNNENDETANTDTSVAELDNVDNRIGVQTENPMDNTIVNDVECSLTNLSNDGDNDSYSSACDSVFGVPLDDVTDDNGDSDYAPFVNTNVKSDGSNLRRSIRVSKQVQREGYVSYLVKSNNFDEPESYAMSRDDNENWKTAINEEFN